MRTAYKTAVLGIIGGALYCLAEVLWRGHSHWTMALLGGCMFVLIGAINEGYFTYDMPLCDQALWGAAAVTAAELAVGLVVNVWLGWGVWDYSSLPCNLWGQICLQFSVLWFALAIVAVVLDDYIRYWLFDEEKPRYTVV